MKPIQFKVPYHVGKAGLTAIMTVIDKEIPSSNEEVGFLMELLTHLAALLDDSVDNVTNVDVTYEQGCGIWHSCNVVVANNLCHTKMDQKHMMELMGDIAPLLDGEKNEDDIEDLQECPTGSGRLQLVPETGSFSGGSGDSENLNGEGLSSDVSLERRSRITLVPDERES